MNAASSRLLGRHPVVAYFVATFTISWFGAFCVAAPYILRHQTIPKLSGILMFPAMLLGPSLSSLLLTRIIDGPAGLRNLLSRMRRVKFPVRWYAALLIPPAAIFTTLFLLRTFISPVFTPGFFLIGTFFGIPAGFFEEIGWTGFAFPRMSRTMNPLAASLLLGLLWGLWHLPVIDFLGATSPHGRNLVPYFFAFTAAMSAMRVLIGWVYINTGSILLSQLLHISSTGALVVFSPPRVSSAQEAFWYFSYAILLWIFVAVIAASWGRGLSTLNNLGAESAQPG